MNPSQNTKWNSIQWDSKMSKANEKLIEGFETDIETFKQQKQLAVKNGYSDTSLMYYNNMIADRKKHLAKAIDNRKHYPEYDKDDDNEELNLDWSDNDT